jgi:hypothetical protein
MILKHIQARPSQPSISFYQMEDLFALLSSAKSKETINRQQEQLKQAAIV